MTSLRCRLFSLAPGARARAFAPLSQMGGVVALLAVAGCASLPAPDGVEAKLRAQAAGQAPLTADQGQGLEAAARRGLLISPAVRQGAAQVAAQADEVLISRARLLPQLGLSLGGGVGDASKGKGELALTGSQLIFDGGVSQRDVTIADIDLQSRYLQFTQEVDGALMRVALAYAQVAREQELVEVYRQQLTAMSELSQRVNERAESGAVSQVDKLEAQRRLQSAEFSLNDAMLAQGEAEDQLMLLAGQSSGGRVELPQSSCTRRSESDALALARLNLIRAQLQLEQAQGNRLPSISLQPVMRHEVGTSGMPVGLNLDLNVDALKGGALSAREAAAEKTLAGAKAGVEAEQLSEQITTRNLTRKTAVATRKAALLERQIALLDKTRQLYRSQYFDMGTRQLSELLDNEEEYYSRQAELAELSYERAQVGLECALQERSLHRALGVSGSLYDLPISAETGRRAAAIAQDAGGA